MESRGTRRCGHDDPVMWWRSRDELPLRPWPRPRSVGIVHADTRTRGHADTQEVAFLDVAFIERMTPANPATQGQAILRRTGEEEWLRTDEVSSLRVGLLSLLDRKVSDDERRALQLVVELIDDSDMGSTGILHVPPAE
jgi:hypothetical protein